MNVIDDVIALVSNTGTSAYTTTAAVAAIVAVDVTAVAAVGSTAASAPEQANPGLGAQTTSVLVSNVPPDINYPLWSTVGRTAELLVAKGLKKTFQYYFFRDIDKGQVL